MLSTFLHVWLLSGFFPLGFRNQYFACILHVFNICRKPVLSYYYHHDIIWWRAFFFIIKQLDAPISQIDFVMKLNMFRTVPLPIIRSLFTVHSAMVCVIPVCRQLAKSAWHIPLLSVQWINSWWWAEELSKTCRVSWQNKFVKLVHLYGLITKKSVTMQRGHMNVKFDEERWLQIPKISWSRFSGLSSLPV
jgi:hypothetical protein